MDDLIRLQSNVSELIKQNTQQKNEIKLLKDKLQVIHEEGQSMVTENEGGDNLDAKNEIELLIKQIDECLKLLG